MIKGAIKTIDIIRHPVILIGLFGLVPYFRLLCKSLSTTEYFYLNILPK